MYFKMLVIILVVTILGTSYHADAKYNTSIEGKIMGGENATIEEFPYQVSVQYNFVHLCGGAIIDASTILTSAHCLYGRLAENMTVNAGHSNVRGGVWTWADLIVYHPEYDDDTLDNDIGIIKLYLPLTFSERINPITLPSTESILEDGALVTVAGWGRLSYQGDSTVDLQKAIIPVINIEICKETYQKWLAIIDAERHICAGGAAGVDSCSGDSGGAIVFNNIAVGLVSWGHACGIPNYPTVHTSILYYLDWITEYLD